MLVKAQHNALVVQFRMEFKVLGFAESLGFLDRVVTEQLLYKIGVVQVFAFHQGEAGDRIQRYERGSGFDDEDIGLVQFAFQVPDDDFAILDVIEVSGMVMRFTGLPPSMSVLSPIPVLRFSPVFSCPPTNSSISSAKTW